MGCEVNNLAQLPAKTIFTILFALSLFSSLCMQRNQIRKRESSFSQLDFALSWFPTQNQCKKGSAQGTSCLYASLLLKVSPNVVMSNV